MKPRFALALAALPLPLAQAQAVGDMVALTPVASLSAGALLDFQGVSAGTPVAPILELTTSGYPQRGTRLYASTASSSGTVIFNITSLVMFLTPSTGQSAGTSPSPAAAGAAHGPVEFLARVHAAPGTTGQLAILCNRFSSATSTGVNLSEVDIHADGTAEVTATGPSNFPVAIGASGQLRIRVRLENHWMAPASGTLFSNSQVNIRFLPDPVATCSITPYGTGCGGAASSGSELLLGTTRAVTLLGSGGFAQAPMLSVFGTSNTGPMLPGGCLLQNDASIVVLLASDPNGFAVHSFTLPATAIGTLYHQFVPVELGTFAIRASNGLDITCVR